VVALALCALPRLASAAECALPDSDQFLQDSATPTECDRFAFESPLWVDLMGDEPVSPAPASATTKPAASDCSLASSPGGHLTECPSPTPTARRAAAIARVRSRMNPPVRSHRPGDGVGQQSDALAAAPTPAPIRDSSQPLALPNPAAPPLLATAASGWPDRTGGAPSDAPSARLERPPRAA
jgi:hypothetical protein